MMNIPVLPNRNMSMVPLVETQMLSFHILRICLTILPAIVSISPRICETIFP